MPANGTRSSRRETYARTAIDAAAYAVVVAIGTITVALVGAVVTGGGLARAKLVLFLAGWLLLAVATARLWPRSRSGADDESGGVPTRQTTETRVEGVARSLPLVRRMDLPAAGLSPPAKLFVGAVLVLLTSLLLEVVGGVS